MILVQKKLLRLRPCSSLLSTALLSSSLRLLTSSLRLPDAAAGNPPPDPPFPSEYLIASCGLSPERAIRAYPHLAHLKSPSNPDAVLRFLKQAGLSAADIASAVYSDPRILCSSVEKTLKPKTMELREMGLSPTQIAQLISLAPCSFRSCDLKRKLEFWMPVFGAVDKLLGALRRNHSLFCSHLEKVVMRNISILRECGFSVCDIAKSLMTSSWLVTMKPDSVQDAVQRAEDLGVPRDSRAFLYAVMATSCLRPSTVDAKIELLKNLGWSQDEVSSAIRKSPLLLKHSQEKLRRNAEFLTKEVGCRHSDVASYPQLLMYSLKLRLIPRHYIQTILKSKGLPGGKLSFYTAMVLSDKKFKERFVLPNEESIPGLSQTYDAACAGRFPSEREP